MKIKLAAVLVGMLALNTAFALERPWEKIGTPEAVKMPEAVKTPPVETASQGMTLAGVPLDNALVIGNSNARFKVVVFTGPNCSYCGKLHQELKIVLQKRNDVVFFVKLSPLVTPKNEYWKSRLIVCSKSVQMLEDVFSGGVVPKGDCDTTEIYYNILLAQKMGIEGIPALIFANGNRAMGAKSADAVIKLIEENTVK